MRIDHPITDYQSVMTDQAQLLDVREPREVERGTLPGARNIALGELPERLSELDSGRRTVVFCKSGVRSDQAADVLVEAGFTDVVNLEGGMLAWDRASKVGTSRWSLRALFAR